MANYANVPIINHIHGSEFDNFYINAKIKKKKLIKKVYGKCDKLIALSEEWKEKFGLIFPIENIVVIENYGIITKNLLKSECNNQIVFLGAITKMKGCYDIPDVVEYVVKEIPDCKFVIAGEGDIKQIKALVKEKNIEENVIFPGWVRGITKEILLRESDIFFLPSYTEGMPMSILDAMGYALPIVSTNVGGIPKLVRSGENGHLSEPGDVEGFSNGIINLLQNKNKLKNAGIESYKIVKEKYSLEAHVKLLSMLYDEIIF